MVCSIEKYITICCIINARLKDNRYQYMLFSAYSKKSFENNMEIFRVINTAHNMRDFSLKY